MTATLWAQNFDTALNQPCFNDVTLIQGRIADAKARLRHFCVMMDGELMDG